jgi:hypothetical protein
MALPSAQRKQAHKSQCEQRHRGAWVGDNRRAALDFHLSGLRMGLERDS